MTFWEIVWTPVGGSILGGIIGLFCIPLVNYLFYGKLPETLARTNAILPRIPRLVVYAWYRVVLRRPSILVRRDLWKERIWNRW